MVVEEEAAVVVEEEAAVEEEEEEEEEEAVEEEEEAAAAAAAPAEEEGVRGAHLVAVLRHLDDDEGAHHEVGSGGDLDKHRLPEVEVLVAYDVVNLSRQVGEEAGRAAAEERGGAVLGVGEMQWRSRAHRAENEGHVDQVKSDRGDQQHLAPRIV